MYIAIYVSAIVLFFSCAIVFFILKDKKNKKMSEILQKKAREENYINSENTNNNSDLKTSGADKSYPNEVNIQEVSLGELEDFSLEFEDKKIKKKKVSAGLNPFSLDENMTQKENAEDDFSESLQDDSKNDDDDLDQKFKEYEDFLRRNLDLDDELESEGIDAFETSHSSENRFDNDARQEEPRIYSDDDLQALQNFDYDSLKGKNDEEIAEIIKSLPPKAQEILMSDILARRKFDDED